MQNETLQWLGALGIIAGHVFNALAWDGWNIAAFAMGTVAFLIWSVSVRNRPQTVVNIVAMIVCVLGLVRAYT